ncbi:Lsr2 family protein [Kitasatospora aureofaciens]|uniref:Lsr2 DNA-binding domain-containing protein n=1 Tax=Kitasatospora aureofaciens TaxID=1894 RepID=A0A1E7NE96_KITAU|nr:Lsr2 family protein [Kitasatospora aureofaciens]ARF83250.1 hypothetical protein B6264_30385 [Kitasatospora aureofaciens]OEV39020.1 hypothetical protein HS99_0018115 [Kitasatospora aureofaciens]GGU99575.1 hypothetical protein GCM10010502_62580 [Kitasatospora aureofaciens]
MPSDTANPATVLIAAESIDLSPTEPQQDADAAVRTARHARDEEDLVLLLTALGLPSGENDLARLAPHLATQAGTAGRPDQTHGGTPVSDTLTTVEQADVLANLDPMTREVALSMRYRGDSPLKILAATGLTEDELQALAARNPQTETGDAGPEFGTAVDELLAWGAQHPQAKVQRAAEQARQALEKLTAQREADQAVAAYEAKVATLKAQLASAEQALRDAKAGKPTTSAPSTRAGAAAGSAELAQPADKTVRNTIRAWANLHGHPVADRGVIPQAVLRAWYDAHPDTLAQAG